MFSFKIINLEDLKTTIQLFSRKTNIPPYIVEKDYWLTLILNYLFNFSKWKQNIVFKGGTSLSKCFGIIKRFSEDIDLILDWRVLGYKNDEIWSFRNNSQQNKFNNQINIKTQEFLEEYFLSEIKKFLRENYPYKFDVFIEENDKQSIIIKYPKLFSDDYISPQIKLEIGVLAALTPSKIVNVKPDLYSIYPQLFEGTEIKMKTVLPSRTFWEKITILHKEHNRDANKKMNARYARHYYVVYSFIGTDFLSEAFLDYELLYKVVQFKQKFYYTKWAKYEEATIDKIKIVPEEYRINEIKEDYEHMKQMIYGDIPPFELIIENLKILEEQIHKLNKK